jgi:hypothetical protein
MPGHTMKKKGKSKMNMGGMMSAVGSSAANRKRNTATGLSGMKRGGMTMKKKGYAKGGMMKKKGYSKGGAMPMGKDPKTGKMIPKFAMDGKGKMARGGTTPSKRNAIVESIIVSEDSGNADTITVTITDSDSAVFNLFKVKAVSANGTIELLSRDLLLVGGDILKVQAATANRLHVVASITEVPQ